MAQGVSVARYHVPNLVRALDILEALGRRPAGLTKAELIERLDVSSNSVYRIAETLIARGYLERDEKTKRFRLTTRMLEVGCAARDERSLVAAGWDVLKELRDETRESVFVGALQGSLGIVLDQVPGLHNVTINVEKGTRFDLHACAPGKCLLAFMDLREAGALLKRMALKAYTPRTIASREGLAREIERIRRRGYATDDAEIMEGVHCVAVPVFDRTRAMAGTIWTVCPAERLPRGQFAARSEVLKRHGARISYNLGYRPETP